MAAWGTIFYVYMSRAAASYRKQGAGGTELLRIGIPYGKTVSAVPTGFGRVLRTGDKAQRYGSAWRRCLVGETMHFPY